MQRSLFDKTRKPEPRGRLLTGDFAALEQAFIAEIRELRAADALAPIAVIVPNHLLRLHLGRTPAEQGVSHANIQFLTLHALARKLAAEVPCDTGTMPPDGAMELLLARAAEEEASRLQYFAPVAQRSGFHRAVLETFRDLRDAGVHAGELKEAVSRLRSSESYLRQKSEDLLLLWERLDSDLKRLRLADSASLFESAIKQTPRSAWLSSLRRLIVYGFYDLTGLQAQLLEASFARAASTAFVPWRDEPAYGYARTTRDWFAARLGPEQALPMTQRPPEVVIVSAPGEDREVDEAIREVLHPASAEYRRFGILLRAPGEYSDLIRARLAGLEQKVTGCLTSGMPTAQSQTGRALLLLARLLNLRWKRSEVMDFASAAALRSDPPVACWNSLTMRAGIVEGLEEWNTRLDQLEWTLGREIAGEDEEIAPRTPELAALAGLRAFLKKLFEGVEQAASAKTWAGMSGGLMSLFEDLAEPGAAEIETARATFDSLSGLDVTGIAPAVKRFQSLLREEMENNRPPAGRFQRNEPTVAALEKVRGVSFDVTVIPGLVEKSFPQPARQDPILFDAERSRLRELLEADGRQYPIPLKWRRRQEETLLFTLAAQSARKRLVLSFPRLEGQNGRSRIASHFLLEMLERMTGAPADYTALEKFLREDSRGRFIPLGRMRASGRKRALVPLEYDLAAFRDAAEAAQPDALLYLTQVTPFFAQALESETARWQTPEFTKYDGVIPPHTSGPAIAANLFDDSGISPSRLEMYANCPFSYFMQYVLGLRPEEEPERAATISPLDQGALVHGILWRFMSGAAQENRALSEADWPKLEEIALEEFEKFERRGVTGYPLAWAIEKRRMLEDLLEFLKHECKDNTWRPALLEFRFGGSKRTADESPSSTNRPALLQLPNGETLRFRGRIDRVDVEQASKDARIIDYKTGSVRKYKKQSFHGGMTLQLPIYLMAVEQLVKKLIPREAQYYFCTARGDWRRVSFLCDAGWPQHMATLAEIALFIVQGIRAGRFYAATDASDCKWCAFRLACGHGRRLDFKWQADVRATDEFLKMRQIP